MNSMLVLDIPFISKMVNESHFIIIIKKRIGDKKCKNWPPRVYIYDCSPRASPRSLQNPHDSSCLNRSHVV